MISGGDPIPLINMTNTVFSRRRSLARLSQTDPESSLSLSASFGEQVQSLYDLVERSSHVFGSPLGPFKRQGRIYYVPRFVYLGPNTSDAAVRLAFLAGYDHRDLRGTLALLHFVERLAITPDIGLGLNLSIFPLVNVLGLAGVAEERPLALQSWVKASAPELDLLEKDARLRSYQGFVRIESAPGEELITVRLRTSPRTDLPTPGVELITSEDLKPFEVRWETEECTPIEGPLTISDDLPAQPFELVIRVPAAWPPAFYSEATASVLKRFVMRYRSLMAYGLGL